MIFLSSVFLDLPSYFCFYVFYVYFILPQNLNLNCYCYESSSLLCLCFSFLPLLFPFTFTLFSSELELELTAMIPFMFVFSLSLCLLLNSFFLFFFIHQQTHHLKSSCLFCFYVSFYFFAYPSHFPNSQSYVIFSVYSIWNPHIPHLTCSLMPYLCLEENN